MQADVPLLQAKFLCIWGAKEVALLQMCREGADVTFKVQHFGKYAGARPPFKLLPSFLKVVDFIF